MYFNYRGIYPLVVSKKSEFREKSQNSEIKSQSRKNLSVWVVTLQGHRKKLWDGREEERVRERL